MRPLASVKVIEMIDGGTENDTTDMKRLGKNQEFKRNFQFLSTFGFISIFLATWEYVLISLSAGLLNGGFGGLFWVFIGTVICYSSVVLSLAEMESMAPTSGGQYHWVSEFAPRKYQRFLSYVSGWMSTLGWLASVAGGVFLTATLTETMLNINSPGFTFTNWQLTLIMLATVVLVSGLNSWGAPVLPAIEIISLVGHIGGFIATLVALLALAPKISARDALLSVTNNGGWDNTGTACLVAQVSVLYCNLGSDSIVHISEEVEDASLVVPRCMWWAYISNVVMALAMLVTMLFCTGDLKDAITSDDPYLDLLLHTGKTPIAFLLSIILFLLVFSGCITALATTSRETWAFSRDKGFPFSNWISRMNRTRSVPFNAIYLTAIFTAIICLINLGSTTAFSLIVSLNLLALVSTYMLSIGCVLYKRLSHQELPPARWSLGRFGLPINAFAVLYCAFIVVFSCFPNEVPTTTESANWAPLVWAFVIVGALVMYVAHGRRMYTAPVLFVKSEDGGRVGGMIEVQKV